MQHIYYCEKCKDFQLGLLTEALSKCVTCNNTHMIKMTLTDEDYNILTSVNNDYNYIQSMDNLKREQVKNLTDEEFLVIIKNSCDASFILAMDKLKEEDIIDFNLKIAQFKQTVTKQEPEFDFSFMKDMQLSNTPKCPTCGSTNIKKISATKRWVGTGLFGIASSDMGKTMQCEKCGYKW